MRRTRRVLLNVAGRDVWPDVGDVLEAPRTWYLVVDCWMARRYLHCVCEVYPKADAVFPSTDGTWWVLR